MKYLTTEYPDILKCPVCPMTVQRGYAARHAATHNETLEVEEPKRAAKKATKAPAKKAAAKRTTSKESKA